MTELQPTATEIKFQRLRRLVDLAEDLNTAYEMPVTQKADDFKFYYDNVQLTDIKEAIFMAREFLLEEIEHIADDLKNYDD